LSFFLGGSCRLRWKLKDRCFLTVAKRGQQDDAPIWEFERVMMRSRLFLVDLEARAAKRLMAANIAKLPELLEKHQWESGLS
jgi:hypothetical protein